LGFLFYIFDSLNNLKQKEMKLNLANIESISPSNEIEKSIQSELLQLCNSFENPLLSTIESELADDPDSFDFSEDDFEVFCFKYQLTDI